MDDAERQEALRVQVKPARPLYKPPPVDPEENAHALAELEQRISEVRLVASLRQRVAELEAERDRLRIEMERYKKLAEHLDRTADGAFVVECLDLYCPKCGGKVRQEYDVCYCDDCPNPDSCNEPPLPLLYGSTLARPQERT